MKFSTCELILISQSLDLAKDEIHNRIATCPDVDEYSESIEELEKQQEETVNLKTRIRDFLNKDKPNGL